MLRAIPEARLGVGTTSSSECSPCALLLEAPAHASSLTQVPPRDHLPHLGYHSQPALSDLLLGAERPSASKGPPRPHSRTRRSWSFQCLVPSPLRRSFIHLGRRTSRPSTSTAIADQLGSLRAPTSADGRPCAHRSTAIHSRGSYTATARSSHHQVPLRPRFRLCAPQAHHLATWRPRRSRYREG